MLYFAPAEQKYNILHKILITIWIFLLSKKRNNLQNSWECMNRETKADKEQITITSHTARKTNNNNMFSKLMAKEVADKKKILHTKDAIIQFN